jgi:hypothetical protein
MNITGKQIIGYNQAKSSNTDTFESVTIAENNGQPYTFEEGSADDIDAAYPLQIV